MYKFVVWGYGIIGKRFIKGCPKEKIVAIIDSNVSDESLGIPFISFEEYKKNYSEYDIVVAMIDTVEVEGILTTNNVYNYFLLDDCPPEIRGNVPNIWLENCFLPFDSDKKYVISGLNFFSILVHEYYMEKYSCNLDILLADTERENDMVFMKKYGFIKKRKPANNEVVLVASRHDLKPETDMSVNIFDQKDKIDMYRNKRLTKFKNIHNNESCFIIGNGPSLRMQDLTLLWKNKVPCFGTNRIYLSFTETEWRPTYYVAIDIVLLNSYEADINAENRYIKFIGDTASFFEKYHENGTTYKIHNQNFLSQEGVGFSDDIETGIYSTATVATACIQIAVYMGFKKIYLLGCDNSYSNKVTDEASHFHKDYAKGLLTQSGKFSPNLAEVAYKSARQYADSHGIKIYNATRGGKLEVFERVDFDSLFK